MANKPHRDRLFPFRVLGYVLYATKGTWLEVLDNHTVRLFTGPASRHFRVKISRFWEALYWLKEKGMLLDVLKEQKTGTVILKLKPLTRATDVSDKAE